MTTLDPKILSPSLVGGRDHARARWRLAVTGASLLAIDPIGLGGLHLQALSSPVRRRWLDLFAGYRKNGGRFLSVPCHTPLDRFVGGLDIEATLKEGMPRVIRGLVEEARGGLMVLRTADRLRADLIPPLLSVLDYHRLSVQREGLVRTIEVSLGVLALDEAYDEEPGLAPGLADRLAIRLSLDGLPFEACGYTASSPDALLKARQILPHVEITDAFSDAVCEMCEALGVTSLRAPLHARQIARVHAALEGRRNVETNDLITAAALALVPRARSLPAPPPPALPVTERTTNGQAAPDTAAIMEAAAAMVQGRSGSKECGRPGGMGARVDVPKPRGARRGVGALPGIKRPALWLYGVRLKALTVRQGLRALLEGAWQRVFQVCAALKQILWRPSSKAHAPAQGCTMIFLLDVAMAGGDKAVETAEHVMKGLLARPRSLDKVALVTCHGGGADVVQAPTRARHLLFDNGVRAALGGRASLAEGLTLALETVARADFDGARTMVVILSGGRRAKAWAGGRAAGPEQEEAIMTARSIVARGSRLVFMDCTEEDCGEGDCTGGHSTESRDAEEQAFANLLHAQYARVTDQEPTRLVEALAEVQGRS